MVESSSTWVLNTSGSSHRLADQQTKSQVVQVGANDDFRDLLEDLDRDEAFVDVRIERRQFGKEMTVVEGLGLNEREAKELCTKLKTRLAAGGTVKDGRVMIQGDHRDVIKKVLVDDGFAAERIRVV